MKPIRRAVLGLALSAIAWSGISATQAAEAYPAGPIKLILPLSAGGSADANARALAERMTKILGKPVVIENRPGASGLIGLQLAAAAPADGLTLLYLTNSMMMGAIINHRKELLGRLTPISRTSTTSLGLVVPVRSPVTGVRTLGRPSSAGGPSSYGSPGTGTLEHVAVVNLLEGLGKPNLTHIPFKSGPEVLSAVMGSHVDVGIVTAQLARVQAAAGKVKVIAVTSSTRLPDMPSVPTVAESGLTGFHADVWGALAVPKGTPPAISERLFSAIHAALLDPGFQQFVAQNGGVVAASTSQASFAREYDAEQIRLEAIAKRLDLFQK